MVDYPLKDFHTEVNSKYPPKNRPFPPVSKIIGFLRTGLVIPLTFPKVPPIFCRNSFGFPSVFPPPKRRWVTIAEDFSGASDDEESSMLTVHPIRQKE